LNITYTVKDLKELNTVCKELKEVILVTSKQFKNQIFFLEAQMGSGKTTFIRNLIQKFNKDLKATSPTFAGMHIYTGMEFDYYHYDLYQVGLNLEELQDILDDEKNKLIFFEWAENLEDQIKESLKSNETTIQTIKIDVLNNEERIFKLT
jgi:tRNA threonylcarbamoyladenosine biosynthesis protein TsaE